MQEENIKDYIEFKGKKYQLKEGKIKLAIAEEFRRLAKKSNSNDNITIERDFFEFHKKNTAPGIVDINLDDLDFDDIEILLNVLSDGFRIIVSRRSAFNEDKKK
ncbi:MAG: hypothetical protein A3K77_00495 [Euryarchaeota archaeon RBG_13_31_8]|nr:MAG: hypothetical protein A3K77_00495 [Euryarchaeota archaeon RBG_13_31_8]